MVNGVASIPIAVSANASEPLPSHATQRDRFSAPYVIGSENQCLNTALQPLVWGQRLAASPLYLFGGPQVGKTHLASGLAYRWTKFFDHRDVQYVTASAFCRDWVTACRAQRISVFRNKYRRVRLLVIEDADRLPSRGKCQVECLHTIDAVHEADGMVVVTGRDDPRHVATWIPPLRSRLRAGLIVRINAPEYATRRAYSQQLAWEHQLELSAARLDRLASSTDVLAAISESMLHATRYSDDDTVRPTAPERRERIRHEVPDMRSIVSATAAFYAVKPMELKNKTRRKTLVLARSVAMYLVREWTGESFQRIGRLFGHRDHSTVLYSYRKIERLLKADPQIQNDLHAIRQTIERMMNCE